MGFDSDFSGTIHAPVPSVRDSTSICADTNAAEIQDEHLRNLHQQIVQSDLIDQNKANHFVAQRWGTFTSQLRN